MQFHIEEWSFVEMEAVQKYFPFALLLLFAIYLLLSIFQSNDLPPGPTPLPIIGNLHQLGNNAHERLSDLAKRFGDIYTLQLGSRRAIVLNSTKCVKEALVNKSNDYSSRPPLASFKASDLDGRGVAFGPYGPLYLNNRRLAHLAMHSFLSDQQRIIEQTTNSTKKLCEKFAKYNGEFDPTFDIKNAIAEMNFEYTFGEDIDPKDQSHLSRLVNEANEFVENNKITNLVDFMPWLMPIFGRPVKRMEEIVHSLWSFVQRIYEEKKGKFVETKEVKCVADALVKCYEKGTNERIVALGEELDLDEENIVTVLTDIFGASCETTSTSLRWALLYVASNEVLQDRLYEELIATKRAMSLNDMRELPLLEATILETLRLSSILPLALPHYAENETTIGKYRVPGDTIILINLWAINHNENVFENPYSFNPERFIDDNGRVDKESLSSLPFSTGTRKCPGDSLARHQLFLFLGGIIKQYKLQMKNNISFDPVFGFMLRPQPYKITVTRRA